MEKIKRMQEFIRRLKKSHACSSDQDAFKMLATVLNAVEDEFSGISYAPDLWMTDGRLYPPQKNSRRTIDKSNTARYRNKGHNTYIGNNGSIKIVELQSNNVLIDKAGSDNLKVDDL